MIVDYLILDWSGVVSDDAPVILPVINKIHAHFGKPPISFPEFQEAYEADIMNYYRKRGMNEARVKELWTEYWGSAKKPQPIPGAPRAVRMHSRLVRIGVFSSHPQHSLEAEIQRYQLHNHITHQHGGANKATIDDLKKHLHKARAKNPLYAGDTAIDATIAHQLGIAFAAVVSKHGYHRLEHFDRVKPTVVVSHIRELEPLLKNGK